MNGNGESARPHLEKIIEAVETVTGLTIEEMSLRIKTPRYIEARAVLYHLLKRELGWTDREIASLVKRERSSVTFALIRVFGLKENHPTRTMISDAGRILHGI